LSRTGISPPITAKAATMDKIMGRMSFTPLASHTGMTRD
jgi:hypothetical protein